VVNKLSFKSVKRLIGGRLSRLSRLIGGWLSQLNRLTWVMKRRRFIFLKEKKKIKRFVLTKTMSFRFMSVRLIGRNKRLFGYHLKGGLVTKPAFRTKFYTDYRTEISR
jgi:hypothetical protein